MTNKTTMALAIAVILTAAPAVQAGSKDDPDRQGGFRIGPLGQIMGGPSTWRGRPFSAYAYVPRSRLNGVYAYSPRSRLNRVWYYTNDDD
jgi:hypothetical protein